MLSLASRVSRSSRRRRSSSSSRAARSSPTSRPPRLRAGPSALEQGSLAARQVVALRGELRLRASECLLGLLERGEAGLDLLEPLQRVGIAGAPREVGLLLHETALARRELRLAAIQLLRARGKPDLRVDEGAFGACRDDASGALDSREEVEKLPFLALDRRDALGELGSKPAELVLRRSPDGAETPKLDLG